MIVHTSIYNILHKSATNFNEERTPTIWVNNDSISDWPICIRCSLLQELIISFKKSAAVLRTITLSKNVLCFEFFFLMDLKRGNLNKNNNISK